MKRLLLAHSIVWCATAWLQAPPHVRSSSSFRSCARRRASGSPDGPRPSPCPRGLSAAPDRTAAEAEAAAAAAAGLAPPSEAAAARAAETAPPRTLLADFWYNCDRVLCLGNALDDAAYREGFAAAVVITLMFASNSPAVRSLYLFADAPAPPALLNAGGSVVAALALVAGGSAFDRLPVAGGGGGGGEGGDAVGGADDGEGGNDGAAADALLRGGVELGVWKAVGTCVNLFGLAATSAAHGAFLIQVVASGHPDQAAMWLLQCHPGPGRRGRGRATTTIHNAVWSAPHPPCSVYYRRRIRHAA